MKNRFLPLAIILTIIVGGCKNKSYDEQCQIEAMKQTSRICPMQVAEGVTLDSIVFNRADRSLRYYYLMEDTLYTDSAIQENRDKFREELLKQVNRSLDLKKAKEHGITFRYIYKANSDKHVALEESFTKEDYQ